MFRETKSGLRGSVRIDLPIALSRDVIIPRLPELVAEHPELELYVSSTDRMVNLYEDGFDCVLRVGTLRDSSLMARHLGDMEMVNCASPSYVRKYGVPTSLADLERHTLVLYATTHSSEEQGWEYWDGAFWRVQPMRGTVTVNNSVAYKAACLAGLGIIQVPKPGMAESLASGELVLVLPELTCRPMPVSLLYSKHPNLPKRVRAVMAWLADVVEPTLLRPSPTSRARTSAG
jgi:DNA-binding transcriptional LysR family regulator